jgi:uncharacterized iron-regulated membrane protein
MTSLAVKALLLRIHRWVFVIFAIPLAVVIVTGLILSFQPVLQVAGIQPGSISLAQIEDYFAKHDPDGKARALRLDHFEKNLTISGVGPEGSVEIDLKSGAEAAEDSWFTQLMRWSRPVHEHFVFDLEDITGIPIVLLSTVGMLFGMIVGVFMGWPRFVNSISGWHKATAWVLLPLLILSPLTGVFMAMRITFGAPAARAQPAPVIEAVRMLAQKHDLSGLHMIRSRGGRQMAQISDGLTRHTYIVSREGLKPAGSNWPRTFHQGDFFGIWGGVMNVILSLAFILLLATGMWIWAKRTFFRKRRRVRQAPATVAAQ